MMKERFFRYAFTSVEDISGYSIVVFIKYLVPVTFLACNCWFSDRNPRGDLGDCKGDAGMLVDPKLKLAAPWDFPVFSEKKRVVMWKYEFCLKVFMRAYSVGDRRHLRNYSFVANCVFYTRFLGKNNQE